MHQACGERWCVHYGHLLKKHSSCKTKELIFQQVLVLVCNSSLLCLLGWATSYSFKLFLMDGERQFTQALAQQQRGACVHLRRAAFRSHL